MKGRGNARGRADLRTAKLVIRSRKEWKDAVEQIAARDRLPSVAALVDRAVAAYVEARGLGSLPPR